MDFNNMRNEKRNKTGLSNLFVADILSAKSAESMQHTYNLPMYHKPIKISILI